MLFTLFLCVYFCELWLAKKWYLKWLIRSKRCFENTAFASHKSKHGIDFISFSLVLKALNFSFIEASFINQFGTDALFTTQTKDGKPVLRVTDLT